jgi:competence protein ComEA
MWVSLLIRLGMWAVTVGIVFWIGWSVPASLDRERETGLASLTEANAQGSSVQSVETTAPQAARPPTLPSRPAMETKLETRIGKLDLNRATAEDFESLPGIGPVLAERIIEYRRSNGTFRTVGDLRLVKGIGKKTFERVRQLVSVTPVTKPSGRGKQTT